MAQRPAAGFFAPDVRLPLFMPKRERFLGSRCCGGNDDVAIPFRQALIAKFGQTLNILPTVNSS